VTNAAERLKSSMDKARDALDPNDLWVRRTSKDPVKVSLPGAPMKCAALAERGTRECRNWAMQGMNVCKSHGGRAPQAKKAAARRLAEVETFQQLVDRVMHSATTDPYEAVETELARATVITEALSQLVLDLDLEDDIILVGTENALVKWLNEERDRKVKFSKVAHDMGISERTVRVQERQVALFAQAVSAMLDDPDLGLNDVQRTTARHVLGRHLRALPSAS
jgi:hypothetical protein